MALTQSFSQLNSSSAAGAVQPSSSCFSAQGTSANNHLRILLPSLSLPTPAIYKAKLKTRTSPRLGVLHLGSLIYKSRQRILNASF